MNLKEIIELNDTELEQLILTKSGAKAFNIKTGADLTAEVKVTSTNLKKKLVPIQRQFKLAHWQKKLRFK